VQSVARDVRRPVIAALARCRREDIERAWQALEGAARPRIHTFLATSDIHLQHKLRLSRRDCLEQARDAVRFAKSFCEDVEFSPEDATRSDVNFLCEVLEAVVEAGATTVNIPDTVGYTVPSEFAQLITRIRQHVHGIGRVVISAHCHDDLGLAVANSLAAVSAGARQVECTVNGIGERAGNTSLEEFVMAVRVRSDLYSFETGVVSQQLYPTSQLLSEITGAGVQANKAIVGRNAFAHEAGIHQDGMIKNSLTYEIMTPESVGVPGTCLVLGKHSGRHALGLRCEQLGFHLDRRELDGLYRQFLVLADRHKVITDHQILELIAKGREKKEPNVSAAASHVLSEDGRNRDHESLASQFPLAYLAKGGAARIDRVTPTFAREHDGEQQEDYLWGV
jgi:2-isopropylmalate synthase